LKLITIKNSRKYGTSQAKDEAEDWWKKSLDVSNNELKMQLCNKAIETYPGFDGVVYLSRGLAYKELNEYEKALTDLNIAFELGSSLLRDVKIFYYDILYSRGRVKYGLEDYYGAIDDLTESIKMNYDLNLGLSYYFIARAKQHVKDYNGAIVDFSKVIELEPDDDDAYYYRGNSKYRLKDYFGAIADYTKAISSYPESA